MTLTLEVAPEVERALEEKAQQQGQTPQEFLLSLVEQAIAPEDDELTPEERAEEDRQDLEAVRHARATSDPAQRRTLDDLRAHIRAARALEQS